MADGSLIFDSKVETGGFSAGIKGIEKTAATGMASAGSAINQRALTVATTVGSAVGNILTTIAASAISGVVQLIGGSIETASNLNEVQNVVNTTFESGAESVNAWAKNAKNAYGMSELKAKQFVSTMGAMLKSSGLAGDSVVTMSEGVSGLAGDMASFYNLDYDAAFEKLRSGISGETEPLKQLGINMSVANLEAFALSKGITKAYDKMSQAEQTTLRYNYLMKATADAQGDFAKTSDGYANQQRILATTMEELSAIIGGMLLPVAQESLKGLLSLADGAKDAIKWVSGVLNPPKSELQQEIDSALSAVDKFNSSIQTAGSNLNTSLESAKATKAMADSLLNNYDKILKKNVLTEADTAQLKMIAQEIVALYPSMGTAIDTTTGLFNDNTTAISKNIDELANKQKADAFYASMQPYTDALISGKVAMTTAFKAYGDAYADWQSKLSNLTAMNALHDSLYGNWDAAGDFAGQLISLNSQFGEYLTRTDDGSYVLSDYAKHVDYASKMEELFGFSLANLGAETDSASAKAVQLSTAYDDTSKTFEEGVAQQKAASDAFYSTAESIEGYVPPLDEAADANGDLAKSSGTASDALAKQKAAVEALKTQIAALTIETLKDIDANVKGFDKVGKVRTQSAKSTLKALQSQQKYLEQYKENYAKAEEKGVSADVLANLQDGSAESAKVLAGLASASAKDVESINSTYASITAEKTTLAAGLATDQAELAAAQATAQAAADAAGTANAATATNTSAEIAKAKGEAAARASEIGTAATDAKTASDSVLTSKDTATQAATDMATEVTTTLTDAGFPVKDAGSALIDSAAAGVAGNTKLGTAVITSVSSATGSGARSKASSGGYTIGSYIAKGIAAGINVNSYIIQNAVETAIQAALDAANVEAEINSPSHLFARMVGSPIAEGIGYGFSGMMEKVNGQMAQSLANSANILSATRSQSAWKTLASNEAASSVTSAPTTIDARQTVIFEQPMQAPDEIARATRRQNTFGLAGARV